MEKSVIRVQKYIEEVDGKIHWSRWQYHENQIWCCKPLEKTEDFGMGEGKFGFCHDEYNRCGEWENTTIEQIDYCPFCGKEIEMIVNEPVVKKGIKYTKKYKSGWKQDYIKWEDGNITKKGAKYARLKIVK